MTFHFEICSVTLLTKIPLDHMPIYLFHSNLENFEEKQYYTSKLGYVTICVWKTMQLLINETNYLSGIFFVLPCIETYQKVDLRTITLGVPPQEVWWW